MEAVSNNSGFGSLFNKVGSIGTAAIESARPSIKERTLRNENRDLSSENMQLKVENRDLKGENRDLKTENRTLEQDVQQVETTPPPTVEPIEAPKVERKREEPVSGEVITAPRRASTPPPSAPANSPAGIYQANAGGGSVGTVISAFA